MHSSSCLTICSSYSIGRFFSPSRMVYQDSDGNTRNLLEVLEQLRTANLNLAEPERGEDEEPDESPRIQM